jgi:glycosyltransferase involved in cell wall biosynthesis
MWAEMLPMNILHIISSGGMYGAEAVILNLSRALNDNQHRSILGVFSNSSNPNLQLHEAAARAGVESHLIQCQGQIDRTVPARIRELAHQTRADVVHAHGYKADAYVYIALRNSEIPLVSTCHNWVTQNSLVSFYGVVDRFVLRKYTAVAAVSDQVKKTLLDAGVRKEKIHKVINGIDLRPFSNAVPSLREDPDSEHIMIVGWVGRLSHEKGADIFLRAAAQTLASLPQTEFVVVGDGPDRNALESLVDELNIQDSVSFVGRREDMPSVYASFDIVVSSSRQEGLPMAILEGMASGKPWIATTVGDVPTVILQDVTGILTPPGNVESLTAALIALLSDPDRRDRLGTTARKLVEEQFSAERMTEDYLRIYRESISVNKIRS